MKLFMTKWTYYLPAFLKKWIPIPPSMFLFFTTMESVTLSKGVTGTPSRSPSTRNVHLSSCLNPVDLLTSECRLVSRQFRDHSENQSSGCSRCCLYSLHTDDIYSFILLHLVLFALFTAPMKHTTGFIKKTRTRAVAFQ